jgi:hypothetical protein
MALALDRSDTNKMQAIQDSMSFLPPSALQAFISSWEDAVRADDPETLASVLEEWHRRARFVAAQRSRPVDPAIDPAEWVEFPPEVMSDR